MGTVGLSFGSPTSGQGFDVTTTVASLVSNLQNVETPWKNQLTTLQSQDTVISNLGSLFSTLSSDISQLTEPDGIMSQMTGSSSDSSVVELTAASSSATAGTHTIVVNSLAATASGYLAPIASASTTLSGSITLKVGSGTAQTITLDSSDDTLAGLASAINSSNSGINASVLTDATGSRLSLVSATSGAGGNIVVSNNSVTAAVSNTLTYTGTAGTASANSIGTLSPVSSASAALSGTISIQVGSGTAIPVDMSAVSTAEGGATLSDLASYINSNFTTQGVQASIVTNSDGTSSLQLYSQQAGSAGTLTVNSSLVDSATALDYTSAVTGQNASLTVDGVALTSASNTVTNLIPGLTFQLLSASPEQSNGSLEPVQVIIANDNSSVESAVNQFVTDYNSLISAVTAQEGNTSTGTAEPLYGSPTISLLQQLLMNGVNAQNPNGYLDAIGSADDPTLSGSMTVQAGNGTKYTFEIGSGTSGSGTFYTGDGANTLADLASTINAADIGVTATVVTANGESSLTFTSQTAGSSGGLSVTSNLTASANTALTSTTTDSDGTTNATATLDGAIGSSDALSGSLAVQVGTAAAQTIQMSDVETAEGGTTLADLQQYIYANSSNLGFSASLITNSDGSSSIELTSNAAGTNANLTVTPNLDDTSEPATTTLGYTNSSDISSLTSLGISTGDDGSLTLDTSTLDSILNSDYSSVANFFQNANSWGQSFSNMLSGAGSSSSTGILALAASSNSTIESELNTKITNENTLISTQQKQLTDELNQANEILQQLPTQLNGMNELYSAITGYNQGTNG